MDIEKLQSCPVCGSSRLVPFCRARDTLHFLEGEFDVAKCRTCTAHPLIERPTKESISYYYPKQYYTHTQTYNAHSLKETLQNRIYDYFYGVDKSHVNLLLFRLFRRQVNMFPPLDKPRATLLDFGCGNGNLIRLFSKYGFLVDGYEVDEGASNLAVEHARHMYSGDFLSLDFRCKYDVIILNQVLEHLHEPRATFSKLHSILADDGALIVSVPNSRAMDFYLLRDCWYAFQAPTHLVHYNAASLRRLAESCGFRIFQTEFSSPLKSIAPRTIRRHLSNISRRCNRGAMLMRTAYLLSCAIALIPIVNKLKGDRITVYMRKAGS